LTGAIPHLARLGDAFCRFSSCRGCLGDAADFIELGHKRVWIGRAIRERLLREPGIVGFPYVGWKPVGIIAHELFVAGVVCGDELHEHRGMNNQRLAALHFEKPGTLLHAIGIVH
jgi:hypothetical protein